MSSKRARGSSRSGTSDGHRTKRARRGLDGMAPELLQEVALSLDYASLAALTATSRGCAAALRDDRMWRRAFDRVYGVTCAHSHEWRGLFFSRMRHFRAGRVHACPRYCVCKEAYHTRRKLGEHVLLHETDPATGNERGATVACAKEGCGAAFWRHRDRRRHERDAHPEPPPAPKPPREKKPRRTYPCGEAGCVRVFKNSSDLRLHMYFAAAARDRRTPDRR